LNDLSTKWTFRKTKQLSAKQNNFVPQTKLATFDQNLAMHTCCLFGDCVMTTVFAVASMQIVFELVSALKVSHVIFLHFAVLQ
jgi:hypothetical protein